MKKLLTILCIAGLLFVSVGARSGELDPGLIDLLNSTPSGQPVSVLVFLKDRVDLKAITAQLSTQKAGLAQHHEAIVRALQLRAQSTQIPVLANLKALSTATGFGSFRSFWIVNAAEVTASPELVRLIASWPQVERIYVNYSIESIAPVDIGTAGPSVGAAVENGPTVIRAPEVWAMGITGAGVLVANIDTGVEGDHPALASRWAGVADSRYAGHPEWAWYDPYLGQNTFPYDNGGHGTHTMGTICGGAPGDQIGVAPGATWIAAAAIDRGGPVTQTVADAIKSFQWMLDPDGNPTTNWDVPDVCSNSWGVVSSHGYLPCDSLFWSYIDACEAAGIVVLFAAGNEGAQGLRRPGDRATDDYRNTAVAAVDGNTAGWPLAYFSSVGPTYCTPTGVAAIKPDISGPGMNVRSAYPGKTYTTMSGTSMATPHIAGVVALMRQANPDLPVDSIKKIIFETAHDLGAAGEDNGYGWGMIDAYAAVTHIRPDTVPPVANFSATPVMGYAPLTVQFTDQSLHTPTSWNWSFGDGTTNATTKNPTHTYSVAGVYNVAMIVTNGYGSDTLTRTNYITVSQPPTPNIHVASITVTRIAQAGRSWNGSASIAIVDELGAPVSGAKVYGYFNAPKTTSKSGSTNTAGVVVLASDKTKTPPPSWCFTVTNVVKAGKTYNASKNIVTTACETGAAAKAGPEGLSEEFAVTNSPNPFNPTTTFNMNLPIAGDWSITIYNIVGERVEELTGTSPDGHVAVRWDASRYPSGVYLYRVVAGENVTTNKMLLLK